MLAWSLTENTAPVALRYPRGGDRGNIVPAWNPDASVVQERAGKNIAILTYGVLTDNVLGAADLLAERGIIPGVFRMTQIEPIPVDALATQLSAYKYVLIAEETCADAGISDALIASLSRKLTECKFGKIDLGKQYITHGAVNKLYAHYGLDADSIANYAQEVLKVEN